MDLKDTNIIVFRNNGRGVVVNWNGKAAYIVGARFTNPINKWDENGKFNKSEEPNKFDIVAVYDGSAFENPTKIFRASTKLDELPVIWAEKK